MPEPRSLLVVDDSAAECEVLSRQLLTAFPEADVVCECDVGTARQRWNAEPFDCIMLDYNLPETNGVLLGGELRQSFAYLPTILLTGVGDELLAAEALRGGLSDYMPKSRVTPEGLHRTVIRAMQACASGKKIDEQRAELELFAYALAHDFKQPIRQISTFSEMISQEIGSDDDSLLHRHLSFLGDAARRLGKLVDVMSQYSLLSQPPPLGAVNLRTVFANVTAALAPSISEQNAEFVVPDGATWIKGNETLMTQVVQNLVANGLQYNRSPSPRVVISTAVREGLCAIDVADNGIGIAPEYLEEIFKPLVRLHAASEYPGTGVGLALARKAIAVQCGALWCESSPGEGSTFHIELPALGRAQ